MATNDENLEEQLLELAVEEQRRVYDHLDGNYQQIKSRTIAFYGAGLAGMTFLYASGDIFLPKETYGRIIYWAALGLVLVGFGLLSVALQSKMWELPTERDRLNKLDFNSRLQYLRYIRDRYITCYNINVGICEKKHTLLRMSFYPLLLGIIVLVIIKIFQ